MYLVFEGSALLKSAVVGWQKWLKSMFWCGVVGIWSGQELGRLDHYEYGDYESKAENCPAEAPFWETYEVGQPKNG